MRVRSIILALMLTASAYGQAPAKSSKVPAVPLLQYGHGTGLVSMDVDYESGRVTAVRMLESTGDSRLDSKALEAFRQWRFKPRTVRHVRTPITFTHWR